jgi:hypothetical protein
MTPIDDAHRGAARGGGTFRLPGDSGGWMRPTTMRAA